MKLTDEFLHIAEKRIHTTLMELRPKLLEAHGKIEHKLKEDKSTVTEMDLLVEEKLKSALFEINASIGFAGEETGADSNHETFWLVDPIDGTEPFVRGLPFSTNMIVLINEGQPVMSVIYNFFLDEYFLAIKGKGATMNGHPIHVSDRTFERGYFIVNSGFMRAGSIGTSDRLRMQTKGKLDMQAAGYEFSFIARGAAEGVVQWNISGGVWDIAPGALLVQEAGGRVENIGKSGYDFRDTNIIAASPSTYDQLAAFTQKELKKI